MMEAIQNKLVEQNPQMFDCGQCVKTFTNSSDLVIHMKLKHAEKPPVQEPQN